MGLAQHYSIEYTIQTKVLRQGHVLIKHTETSKRDKMQNDR